MSAPAIGLRPRVLPSPSAKLDPSHPYGVGMIAAMAPAHAMCLATGRPLTVASSNTSVRPTSWGMAGQPTANNTAAYTLAIGPYPSLMTYLIVADKLSGTSARQGLVVFGTASGGVESTGGFSAGFGGGAGNGWDAAASNGSAYFLLDHGTAWRGFNAGTFLIPDGAVTVGGTRPGTNVTGYINGVASSASETVGSVPGGTLWATIGTGPASRSAGADRCPVSALLIWNRILSARELCDLHADPFQMFRQ